MRGHCGSSAALGFTASWIKLCYEDLPGFLELLSQVPAYHNTKLALEGLFDWYEQCQMVYDAKLAGQYYDNPRIEQRVNSLGRRFRVIKPKRTAGSRGSPPSRQRKSLLSHTIETVSETGMFWTLESRVCRETMQHLGMAITLHSQI